MKQIKLELQEFMGSDRSIAEAAWTSSTTYEGKDLKTDKDIERVINMLADFKHSVPFESVVFRFWMRIPIVVDRQVVTHRIASHSGMSGRYRTMPNEVLKVPSDVSLILVNSNCAYLEDRYDTIVHKSNELYAEALVDLKEAEKIGLITNAEYKRAREFYRGILPQNNITERVSIFNLRSLANFIKLRDKPEAQPEIRHLAQLMLDAVERSGICPIALEALKRNNWSI